MVVASRERPTPTRLLLGVWVAVGIQVVGQLLDLRWHLTHAEFETASDQLAAHWLIWVGILGTLVVCLIGVGRVRSSWYTGYRLLLLALAFLIASEVWRFWEHYNHQDPPVPHLLLGIGKLSVIAGAVSATVLTRRRANRVSHESALTTPAPQHGRSDPATPTRRSTAR